MMFSLFRVAFGILGVASLSACGADPQNDGAPEAAPLSLAYDFDRGDLYADPPRDFCRAHDRDFLMNLMQRVGTSLPNGRATPPEFDSFFTSKDPETGATLAGLKYRAAFNGEPDVIMIAQGEFNPTTCQIRSMRSGPISDFYVSERNRFDVK